MRAGKTVSGISWIDLICKFNQNTESVVLGSGVPVTGRMSMMPSSFFTRYSPAKNRMTLTTSLSTEAKIGASSHRFVCAQDTKTRPTIKGGRERSWAFISLFQLRCMAVLDLSRWDACHSWDKKVQ